MIPRALWWISIFSFATKSLSLICETYDQQKCLTSDSATSKNSTCSSMQQCDHTSDATPACYALFSQNKDGGLDVMMKGCIPQNEQTCSRSSVCNGQRKNLRSLLPLYYCCCTKDRCNRDVVMFISQETEKNCTFKDLKEAIRHLTLLIYVHLMTITIVLSLIVITLMVWKLIYYKRRKEMTRNLRHLPQVVCDRGTRHLQKTSHWKKHDFQLITCLVRSSFGEIWQARLRSSNRIVRIRLTAGSDDVYVYDKHVMAKNTNLNITRVV